MRVKIQMKHRVPTNAEIISAIGPHGQAATTYLITERLHVAAYKNRMRIFIKLRRLADRGIVTRVDICGILGWTLVRPTSKRKRVSA
jgi:hypothetical protein